MKVIISKANRPEVLETQINQELEKHSTIPISIQYQAATVPEIRAKEVTGYHVEYTAMIII